MWVYFLCFELDYVFKLFFPLCVYLFIVEGALLYQFSLLFCSFLYVRDQGQMDPMT